jgi:TolB-like protein/Flp pilus assembly protein TadD
VRDCTADIYALGKTLFIAMTGAPPERFPDFAKGTLDFPRDDPRAERLREVILRACRENPTERFQSARQMHRSIARLQTSIAVLPFVTLSSTSEDASFSLSVAEDLITALARVEGLRVVDKSSAFKWIGQPRDLRHIGNQLDVSTVLDGSVQRMGRRLRIAVRLFDTREGAYLWSEQFDRDAAGVFDIQDEIVRVVVRELKSSVVPDSELPRVKRPTANVQAYDNYAKGRFYLHKLTEERLRKAITHFEQAIQDDPHYAAAYAGLSDCYSGLPYFGNVPPGTAFPSAKEYALLALDRDPASPEAHVALGVVHMIYDWDWPAARREFERAIDLGPRSATTFYWWAHYLAAMGRKRDAIAATRHARELEPLSLLVNGFLGFVLYSAHRYEEAEEICRKAIELDPTFFEPHWILGKALLRTWKYEEGLSELEAAKQLSGDSPVSMAELASAHALMKKPSAAEAILRELERRSTDEYVPPSCFALIHAALGLKDGAFQSLEDGYEKRCHYLIYLKAEPAFEALRSDPRYCDLVGRLGLPL